MLALASLVAGAGLAAGGVHHRGLRIATVSPETMADPRRPTSRHRPGCRHGLTIFAAASLADVLEDLESDLAGESPETR